MERRSFLGFLLAAFASLLGLRTVSAARPEEERETHRGFGICKHRGCYCQKFEGKGNTCKCGHSFYDHR